MLYLKIMTEEEYCTDESVYNLIHYAGKINPNEITLTTGINCSPYIDEAIYEFEYIRSLFQKDPARYARHFMISSDTIKNPQEMLQLAYAIGCYYINQYQVFIGVHTDKKRLHAHFILNTVSCNDGKIYSYSYQENENFMNYIRHVLGYKIRNLTTAN